MGRAHRRTNRQLNINKNDDKCYKEYKKYINCIKGINDDCSILLEEFNKCNKKLKNKIH